jgi:hypothetical protein
VDARCTKSDGDDEWEIAFLSRLNRRTGELASGMGLPVDPAIKLTRAKEASLGEGVAFDVRVGSEVCRIGRALEINRDWDAVEFAERVAEALYWNRALMLNDTVINCLYADYSARGDGNAAKMKAEQLGRLLRESINLGFSAAIALELLDGWAAGRERDFVPDYSFASMLSDRFPDAVIVEVGQNQYDAIYEGAHDCSNSLPAAFAEMVATLRDALFFDLGVKFPGVQIEVSGELDDDQFRIRLGSIAGPVHHGLNREELLVNETVDRLHLLSIKARVATNPANSAGASIIPVPHGRVCEQAGYTTWDLSGYLLLTLSSELRRQAALFMTIGQVEHILIRLNAAFPLTIFNLIERYSMVELQRVLQVLLEERVSVRDLRTIIEAMLDSDGVIDVNVTDSTVVAAADVRLTPRIRPADDGCGIPEQVDAVRAALCWQLTHSHCDYAGQFVVIGVAPATEQRLLQSRQSPLSRAEQTQLRDSVARQLLPLRNTSSNPPLLTNTLIRGQIFELLHLEFPGLAVMSRDEVAPGRIAEEIALIDALAPLPNTPRRQRRPRGQSE